MSSHRGRPNGKRNNNSSKRSEGSFVKSSKTYEIILETVRHIPKGKVATYGEVAEQSGFPGQARLVGYALHNLPGKSGVPWHRVINSRGEISLPRIKEGHARQRKLLEKEKIIFKNGKVDLKKYGWLSSIYRLK